MIQKSYQDLHQLYTRTIHEHEEEMRKMTLNYNNQMNEILKKKTESEKNYNHLKKLVSGNEKEEDDNYYVKKKIKKTKG